MRRLHPGTRAKYVTIATHIITEIAKGKRSKQFITYSELIEEMGGPGRGYIAEVLDEVSSNSKMENGVLLSALVVHTPTGCSIPGDGFWFMFALGNKFKNANKAEKIEFWKKECRKIRQKFVEK